MERLHWYAARDTRAIGTGSSRIRRARVCDSRAETGLSATWARFTFVDTPDDTHSLVLTVLFSCGVLRRIVTAFISVLLFLFISGMHCVITDVGNYGQNDYYL